MAHRLFLLLLLAAATQGALSQSFQSFQLINHDTLHITNCHGEPFRITQSQSTGVLSESLDAYILIETNGVPFDVLTYMTQGNATNRITFKIWDGDSATGTLITDFSGLTLMPTTVTVFSGRLTAHLYRADSSDINFSFELDWYNNPSFASSCLNDIDSLRVTQLTNTTARLQWACPVSPCQLQYGNTTRTIYNNEAYLTGLVPDSEYTVTVLPYSDLDRPCCARTITFRTECDPYIGCPDLTDFQSGSVRAYYGVFYSPYENIGFVNLGSNQVDSRHTVHTDTTETDPCTGNLLRTVCPGTRSSVRLGNWNAGSEAEALEYYLYIDTNLYAFLLLHYAVVLQNPDHGSSDQPHFTMEIRDYGGNVIDPICGRADFAASSSLGWNSYAAHQNVWKDWTTLGFDMTPYHGQTVKVRFTTRDCKQGAHYGYAYFSAECRLNSATTEYCGETEVNTITAPDGFNYLWYYNNPADTVSTAQSVTFTNTDALLHCRLISKENPTCYVTLNTYAGHRWPQAVIDTLATESLGCDGYKVYFINRSVVTNDNGDTVDWHCETARWYFGDAYMSYSYTPQHIYRDSGDYIVTLISGIANNSCRDTTHFTLHIPDFYIPALKDTFACDTFWINDVAYPTDGLGPSYRVHHADDCDTLYTLNLHILPSPHYEMPPDTFCYSATYSWRNQTAGDPHITDTTSYRLVDRLLAANGCDSTISIRLVQLPPDRIGISSQPDCSNKRYTLTATTDLPYLSWSSMPHDTSLDGHESDRTLLVAPASTTIYTVTSDHRDTLYCPTSVALTLQPTEFPQAQLAVNPAILTYDHPEFDAHDLSRYASRQWGLQTFPGNGDTLFLAEPSAHLHYTLDNFDIDSLKVILTVIDNYCYDTTHLTLPFVRTSVWAPNVFTPSEDANRLFAPLARGLLATELYIYDRAGRLVFITQDLGQGWDGTSDGRPCPQGTYVWLLRYQAADYPDVWRTTSGSVTLIR